ncbi:MAG: hypothetical protein RI957_2186 [Verrucomicrobiota bacterium]
MLMMIYAIQNFLRCFARQRCAFVARAILSRGFPVLGMLFCSIASVQGFPPAPYYTIYGIVRDQVGQTIMADNAVVILLKGGVEVGRTPIKTGVQIDQNYELQMRMDHSRTGTTFYTDQAIATQGLYSLVVSMNGVLFYPIEVNGTLKAGKGSERVRLDLNLGEDLDKDGLPDAWEAWQLYQAGLYPDENGNWDLSLINGSGDYDKDGLSNLLEYIAGTFAGDATEVFSMDIKEKLPQQVKLEFFGITGKTYTIESSVDLKTWTQVNFSVGAPSAGSKGYTASNVALVTAFTVPRSNQQEFYRLTVR